ncbi:double-strand break repair protein AddB [Henriciella sp.]|uniref:double-strand break repair protein AddB n=1 Tax=Henriciella sp. TaxID=1968823 RepID=UPI0026048FAA|nr:double-strand break repair protein AddB [Henriciella sp.]
MSRDRLFDAGAPKVRTIPAGADTLTALATTLAREKDFATHPDALADDLIYVPNRRSARALALALHRAAGGKALLMPDIRPLGDLESDEPPPGAESALADLPPAISPAERLGRLAVLVSAYYEKLGQSIPPASSIAAARELSRLLDQAALSGNVDWDRLDTLVAERQLAEHWQKSVNFLDIITRQWPEDLERNVQMDPYARRLAAAEATAKRWQDTPPKGDIIIAGSTGADPSGRILMKAALTLPRSLIVLPGLDREVSHGAWERISETPNHPQFTIARTLASLGLAPHEVAAWPGLETSPQQNARRTLVHEALAPADDTSGWLERLDVLSGTRDRADFARDGFSGLTMIEADDESDEAWCAALLLRLTLETGDQTAALVTPDTGLARRVSALLRQWDVHVAPSGGTPLLQTPAGSLAALVMEWVSDPTHPVSMLAVLKHAQVEVTHDIAAFERFFLRGPRRWDDWASLNIHIKRLASDEEHAYRAGLQPHHAEAALALSADLQARFHAAGLDASDEQVSGMAFLEAVSDLMGSLGATPLPWAGPDGAALSTALRDFAEVTKSMAPATPEIWTELFKAFCTTIMVREEAIEHPRLNIWGPLEARLQSADRLILAGLNEGVWPAQPPADAFLPRSFRREIGLNDPDERIGLSAHDFAQMAAAPNVTLLSSRRREDAPAISSRWLWRLNTLARGALGEEEAARTLSPQADQDPREWLKALRKPEELSGFRSEPRPKPPLEQRPKGLSVTRIEALQRDPYAIYAQYVLGLTKLDALDMPVDARPRGTAIHAALEKFEEDGVEKSAGQLVRMLEEELRAAGEAEDIILGAMASRKRVAEEYLAWRHDRLHEIAGTPYTELKGSHTFPVAGAEDGFRLTATADRIEKRHDGSLAILDFKSGAPPGEGEVRTGLNPQMPLQAVIALEAGFPDRKDGRLSPYSVSELTYVRFGTQFAVRHIGEKVGNSYPEKPVEEIIDETREGFLKLVAKFADPDHPYVSMPRPKWAKYGSDYARLARRDEWAAEDGDD